VTLHAGGSTPGLFCVHPVSGSVVDYVALARALGGSRPIHALQAPGLDDGGEPRERIEELAAYHRTQLRAIQPDGPYLLAGWSMGGMVAFELARQLEEQAEQVAMLAVLDVWPAGGDGSADAFGLHRSHDEQRLLDAFVRDLGMPPEAATLSMQEFWQLDEHERLEKLADESWLLHLLPPDVAASDVRTRLQVFTAHLRALRRYAPRSYGGDLTFLPAAQPTLPSARDAVAAWEQLAGGRVTVHQVPGDHYTMLRHPQVERLAAVVQGLLRDAVPVSP
jgi:thioesterase domain-containing protein